MMIRWKNVYGIRPYGWTANEQEMMKSVMKTSRTSYGTRMLGLGAFITVVIVFSHAKNFGSGDEK